MKILFRYIFFEQLKSFIIILLLILIIYLGFDIIFRVDNFIEARTGLWDSLLYFFYKIPYIIYQIIPPALILSSIYVVTNMKRNRELIILKAGGIDIRKILIPFIIWGTIISLFLFIFLDSILPVCSRNFYNIWYIKVEKRGPYRVNRLNRIWYRVGDRIFYIPYLDIINKKIISPSIFYLNNSFKLIKKISAKEARWVNNKWILYDVISVKFLKDRPTFKRFNRLDMDLQRTPTDFLLLDRKSEEMSLFELRNIINELDRVGINVTRYKVDFYYKISYIFMPIIIIVLGAITSLKIKNMNILFSQLVGIMIIFFYALSFMYCRSLSISEILPPLISAWIPSFLSLSFLIYLITDLAL